MTEAYFENTIYRLISTIGYNRLSFIQMDTGNDETDCGVHELSTSEQESSTKDDSSTMGEVNNSFASKVQIL